MSRNLKEEVIFYLFGKVEYTEKSDNIFKIGSTALEIEFDVGVYGVEAIDVKRNGEFIGVFVPEKTRLALEDYYVDDLIEMYKDYIGGVMSKTIAERLTEIEERLLVIERRFELEEFGKPSSVINLENKDIIYDFSEKEDNE